MQPLRQGSRLVGNGAAVWGTSRLLFGGTVLERSSHRATQRSGRATFRLLAPLALVGALLGLLAAGCSSSSTTDTGQVNDTTPRGAQQGNVIETDAKPVPGGRVVYGLEAESDGFNPTKNRWAIAGVMVGLAVYDPLAAYNDKSEARPYLAESFGHNDKYTEWTITLRKNITFSNGSPLTAAAVKQTLDAHHQSILTKPVFSAVEKVTTKDDFTVVVTMTSPWVVFPSTLTAQTGVIPAPESLGDDGANPVGTGPFVQKSWSPNDKWVGAKNKSYWRKDKDGTSLPYLDEIEFRPIPLQNSRGAALESGDLQMMHTNDSKAITKFRALAKDKKFQMVEDNGEGEEGFALLNSSAPPFDDLNARRALAYATDTETYGETINDNVFDVADGPFRKNSKWRSDFKNYPTYDPAKAQELVQKYKDEHGGQPPTFSFGITSDSQQQAQALVAMWNQVGFVADVKTVDQAAFIIDAVQGKYQANLWRQFGAPDPDADLLWWVSENAEGPLTLNIARHKSPCQDAAMKKGRENADEATRKAAYADLQQCFADEVPYVWLDHTVWTVIANNKVHGITNGPLPDGTASLAIGGAGDFGGVTRMTQVWIEH
jgi:ABC-type transport system substrate-binding protein